MIVKLSAILFSCLVGIVVLFQFGLALGMPWGKAAMGGKYPGKFPVRMRIASVVQMFILITLAIIVLIKAELIIVQLKLFSVSAIWIVVVFSTISTILNIITRSKIERNIWAPTSILLLVTSIIIALA
jgi:hypothetical protein